MGVKYNPYHARVVIGKYTSIANGLRIVSASHPSVTHNTVSNFPFCEKNKKMKLDYPKCTVGGKITIGNDVWIGEMVNIVGEVNIGDGAIIGAFSTVAKDVPPYAIVAGNPIKTIRYRFDKRQIELLLEIKWWDWERERIFEALPIMTDINKFLDFMIYE